jgi:hypothetical protein
VSSKLVLPHGTLRGVLHVVGPLLDVKLFSSHKLNIMTRSRFSKKKDHQSERLSYAHAKNHMLVNLGPIQPPSRIRMSISISFLVKVKSYKV